MLSIGFAYALVPLARSIFKRNKHVAKLLLRHLSFFNAHPYVAPFAIGAVARIESENADPEEIGRLKNALIGPLGAIGDQLFWATIRPASALIAVCGVLLLPEINWKIGSIIVFLLAYNIPHIYVRWNALLCGYRMGFRVYQNLNMKKYKVLSMVFLLFGAFSLGAIVGTIVADKLTPFFFEPILFIFALLCTYILHRYRTSFYSICAVVIILTTLTGVLFESL